MALVGAGVFLLSGCTARPDQDLVSAYYSGDSSAVREAYAATLIGASPDRGASESKPDRNYVLNHMRLGMLNLADGYAREQDLAWDRVLDVLGTQGVNRGSGATSLLLNEDLKVWKGEPFEQALARHYIGLHYASQGSWDNALAASRESLFPLVAVGSAPDETPRSTEDLMSDPSITTESFDPENTVTAETDFALGYLMAGVSAHQLARKTGDLSLDDEAQEYFDKALSLRPDLDGIISEFKTNLYNTVLVIDHGRGPQKIGTGPDQAIASFSPHTPSSPSRVVITDARGTRQYLWACDVNAMAQNHMWNNLQDMRLAKSYVGTALVAAGAGTAAYGGYNNNSSAGYVGLAMMLAGAFSKAGGHADTRYCELMPQRIYVVPALVSAEGTTITLQVEDAPETRIVLPGLTPQPDRAAQLRYVRLVDNTLAPWATSGGVNYANDFFATDHPAPARYILGGACVRTPSEEVVALYRKNPALADLTLDTLLAMYREEGIAVSVQEENGTPRRHILEGGTSLACPLPGTLGFTRLMNREHRPYEPKGMLAREWSAKVAAYQAQATESFARN